MSERKYALLAVGELLADFIGTDLTDNLLTTEKFQRFQGGSPSNLAANMARLGNQTAIVSCVGKDNLGTYLIDKVKETGVDTAYVVIDNIAPTTIVVVSRSKGTPDFITYREADCRIQSAHISDDLLKNVSVFHTTCFALSRNPAQESIVEAAGRAARHNCQLSIDLNYAPQIWPDRNNAHAIVKAYVANGAFVKMSEDDVERFYNRPVEPDEAIADFHSWGAKLICFTLGSKGSIVSSNQGRSKILIEGKKIKVIDTTGAGDSYWAGFLTAYIDGFSPEICARAGANIAALKLNTLGPLPAKVDRQLLYR
ncbi:carbohydrate kinase family protein [Emticicia sp. BO119]|uniref:carbohydrate kinase family protein n=1 Tax=Emticicia sp. BO119 TaxID=2757768 RepID=UPI0015F0065A|nr:sugar kinase [Emticicia sp. BO119]MBA4851969.1 sugar kinase [Emticicia sp. BO119]